MDNIQFYKICQLERDLKMLHDMASELIDENEQFHEFSEKVIDFATNCRVLLSRASEVSDDESRTIIISDTLFQKLSQRLEAIETDLGCQDSSAVSGVDDIEAEMRRLLDQGESGSGAHAKKIVKL